MQSHLSCPTLLPNYNSTIWQIILNTQARVENNTVWGKGRFIVIHVENSTVINKQEYKNKLSCVLTTLNLLLPALYDDDVTSRTPCHCDLSVCTQWGQPGCFLPVPSPVSSPEI